MPVGPSVASDGVVEGASADGPTAGLVEATGDSGGVSAGGLAQPTRMTADSSNGVKILANSRSTYGSMIVVVQRTVLSGAMARMLAEEVSPASGSIASA